MEFYGYAKCSTCRKAHQHLKARGHDIPFQDFVVQPPDEAMLRRWIQLRGEGVAPFINVKGTQYRALGLKDKQLTDDEWIRLFAQDGKLLKRPLLVLDNEVVLGYDAALYDKL